MKFTYESYADMIKHLGNMEYQFADYRSWKDSEKSVILRHDVDYSLQKAAEFSGIEREMGVQSTYFVLLSTNFYNVHSLKSKNYIRQIMDNGGKIGLHFDETQYDIHTEEELEKCLYGEAEILSDITGVETGVVSMHRPSEKFLSENRKFGHIINSYGKLYFNEMKYLSDSRRNWRENVDEIIRQGTYWRLHILIHPFWYFAGYERDMKHTLKGAIFNASLQYYDELGDNFSNLGEEVGRDEIEILLKG
ncbi:MAG TPA: hypothetical protein DDY31_18900 [Lachnospiraceae bacterium]|nr:hypothetical protein [Lachnospiraceae bacterium]